MANAFILGAAGAAALLVGIGDGAAREAAPSFDCAKAQSQAEELVCSDAELAALDGRLATRFSAALEAARSGADATGAVDALRASQRGWIKGRDECWKAEDLRTCVLDAYLRREGQLVASWMLEEPMAVASYACEGNPANEVTVYYFDTELPSVRIEYGDSIDTGSQVRAASGARYEASHGRSVWSKGDTIFFVWNEGEDMTCKER